MQGHSSESCNCKQTLFSLLLKGKINEIESFFSALFLESLSVLYKSGHARDGFILRFIFDEAY